MGFSFTPLREIRRSADARICRIEGVASSYFYASALMSSTAAATVSSALLFISEAPADYGRLSTASVL
jgi:hypothetical protein